MKAITVLNLFVDFIILLDLACLFVLGRSLGIIFDCPEDPLLGVLIFKLTGVQLEPSVLFLICCGLIVLCSALVVWCESRECDRR
ncbi:MAG: hypothetical protein E7Z70_02145 [Thermoplasmata archaeon]|nr:hypothetical protein [Thermoplasmata archaeon]